MKLAPGVVPALPVVDQKFELERPPRVAALTLVNPPPLPLKAPVRVTPLSLLVTTEAGVRPPSVAALTLVNPPPLPLKAPVRVTPFSLLVTTEAGVRPPSVAAFTLVNPPPSPEKLLPGLFRVSAF